MRSYLITLFGINRKAVYLWFAFIISNFIQFVKAQPWPSARLCRAEKPSAECREFRNGHTDIRRGDPAWSPGNVAFHPVRKRDAWPNARMCREEKPFSECRGFRNGHTDTRRGDPMWSPGQLCSLRGFAAKIHFMAGVSSFPQNALGLPQKLCFCGKKEEPPKKRCFSVRKSEQNKACSDAVGALEN